MAGESAREQARTTAGGTATPSGALWDRSADSEASIGRALEELRASPGWTVLHDVPWPGPQQAYVRPRRDRAERGVRHRREELGRRDHRRGRGAAGQRLEPRRRGAAARPRPPRHWPCALPEGLGPGLVQPVLCFARDEWVSERIGDVLICSSQNVVAQLKTRRHVLDHATVERLAAELTGFEEARPAGAEPEPELQAEPEPPSRAPGRARARGRARRTRARATGPSPRVGGRVGGTCRRRAPVAGRHGRARRRRFARRSRVTQVIGGLGLLAVVALRPDALQPVGSFVSDLLVQEADADNGDSTTEPTAKAKPGKAGKASEKQAGKQRTDKQAGDQTASRHGWQPGRQREEPRRLSVPARRRQEVAGSPSHHQMSRTTNAKSARGVP